MKTLRQTEITRILRYVENDYIDSDGKQMENPSKAVYQALNAFLLGIDESLFLYLISDKGSVQRLPDGNIFVDLRNERNKGVLGVYLGENYTNFFYIPQKNVRILGEANDVKQLLENNDFISSTQDLLRTAKEKNKVLNLDFTHEAECKPFVPKYSHVS
jgi:hypothetical protein